METVSFEVVSEIDEFFSDQSDLCAVADQLDGDQARHAYYREQICDFMRTHQEDFRPFIVDQPFNTFMRALSKLG